MNFFEKIDELKVDLPKLSSVNFNKFDLNIYQKIAVIIYVICLFLGILLGNLFPSCGSSSEFYSNVCVTTEFNFSLMLFIWFVSFLICLLFYALGHIISLLTSINNQLSKKK